MTPAKKNLLYKKACDHVAIVRAHIATELSALHNKVTRKKRELASLAGADQMVEATLVAYNHKRIDELEHLHPSPYFFRCNFVGTDGTQRSVYLAKFTFMEEGIYSWVTPFAAIRFEKTGPVTYIKPGGRTETATLLCKEQFMIVDGAIKFLGTETLGAPRELVYQEHFSNRKTGFVLPEIVAQMEKAQDQVIRADHRGPLVISGPAGSGKTTLALHRVAYLAQAPDTAALFPGHATLVFVQDAGTKAYFSHLLPELGIHDVTITTFTEWAGNILELTNVEYVQNFDCEEFGWQKLQALKQTALPNYSKKIWCVLEQIYAPVLDTTAAALFKKQTAAHVLDRIDLTLLLRAYARTHGQLEMTREYYVQHKNHALTKKLGRFPLEYALVVIDEFQNYLPGQLQLMRSGVRAESNAVLYVGDLAQQIYFGTIRDWAEIREQIAPERQVRLEKVYRNTKEILKYIRAVGYEITIPTEIKSGAAVAEQICAGPTEEIAYVEGLMAESGKYTIGVLAANAEYLTPFKKTLDGRANVHVLTMAEAQGVEFDIACIVGLDANYFLVPPNTPADFAYEKQRIQTDLLYVALTRAMAELHVLGRIKLSTRE